MSHSQFSAKKVIDFCEMSVTDGLNYVLFQNPVSATVLKSVKDLVNATMGDQNSSQYKLPSTLANLKVQNLVYSGNPFVKLAGLSGATAVVLGAYGAHTFYVKEGIEERKKIYQTANTYHFIHSLALLGAPLCTYPKTAGSLLAAGMLLFCGTCYYDAFTGEKSLRRFTPIGGTCLIFGWLCLLL